MTATLFCSDLMYKKRNLAISSMSISRCRNTSWFVRELKYN